MLPQFATRRLVRGTQRTVLRLLRATDPRLLALLAHRPARDVGRLVVTAVLPLRFTPERARGVDATFELRLRHADGDGHDPVAVHVADGRCTARPRPADDADATVSLRLDDLVRLVTGQAEPQAMLGDGRITVGGNVLLFMRFPGMFGGVGRAAPDGDGGGAT